MARSKIPESKIYLPINVWEAARRRIAYIFDEFDHVVVQMSGGKDSTVIFHLALMEAERRGRLPLTVRWLDQEFEWRATVEYMTKIMEMDVVKPEWFQVEMIMSNASSSMENQVTIWEEGHDETWIHPKHRLSIKDSGLFPGLDRFHTFLSRVDRFLNPDRPVAMMTGMRTEESAGRLAGLTSPSYKGWVSWATALDKRRRHYAFHPIYDWTAADVWAAISKNGWEYNRVYNYMFAKGRQIRRMRVSNLIHENAIIDAPILQEFEPDTYERIVARTGGIDAISKVGNEFFKIELPAMFGSWEEYIDWLAPKLLPDKKQLARWLKEASRFRNKLAGAIDDGEIGKLLVKSLIRNDWEGTWLKITLPQKYRKVKDYMRKQSSAVNGNDQKGR